MRPPARPAHGRAGRDRPRYREWTGRSSSSIVVARPAIGPRGRIEPAIRWLRSSARGDITWSPLRARSWWATSAARCVARRTATADRPVLGSSARSSRTSEARPWMAVTRLTSSRAIPRARRLATSRRSARWNSAAKRDRSVMSRTIAQAPTMLPSLVRIGDTINETSTASIRWSGGVVFEALRFLAFGGRPPGCARARPCARAGSGGRYDDPTISCGPSLSRTEPVRGRAPGRRWCRCGRWRGSRRPPSRRCDARKRRRAACALECTLVPSSAPSQAAQRRHGRGSPSCPGRRRYERPRHDHDVPRSNCTPRASIALRRPPVRTRSRRIAVRHRGWAIAAIELGTSRMAGMTSRP